MREKTVKDEPSKGEQADEHLASCVECQRLQGELRLNALALREMKARPRLRWEWALAAAAAILIVLFVARGTRTETTRMTVALVAPQAPRVEIPQVRHVRPRIKKHIAAEPLRVKMLTSDPDVVIYWIVDRKEGFE